MPTKQGDIGLLQDPVAQELLGSRFPAQLAYTWTDGTPRVVPIWFHWDGSEFVLGSPSRAPKLKALARNPRVALTINSDDFPYKVLLVRGSASVEMKDDVTPEYAASARRYFGDEQGAAWVEHVRSMPTGGMARIAIRPEWVGILDFQTRFPSAISS
jgi:PPOX class probable F420-dependent enzyme